MMANQDKTRALEIDDETHPSQAEASAGAGVEDLEEASYDVLRPGEKLLNAQFRVERYLSAGGFGTTYVALDSLDRKVVIKECFPNAICFRAGKSVRPRSRSRQKNFQIVVQKFREEALRLAKLDHPNIVKVHQVFDDNETAYMALDYVTGQNLLEIIKQGRGALTPDKIKTILLKLLDALAYIHDQNMLHRDISPDNILLDGRLEPVLIDFGAARDDASRTSRALSTMQIVKDGYSPQEFYIDNGKQSQCSDIYSLAATFYHLITGEAPPNSQVRLAAIAAGDPDPYVPIPPKTAGYDRFFLGAIDKALKVLPQERLQTALEWVQEIDEESRVKKLAEKAKQDTSIELSIKQIVQETNKAEPTKAKPRPPRQTRPAETAAKVQRTKRPAPLAVATNQKAKRPTAKANSTHLNGCSHPANARKAVAPVSKPASKNAFPELVLDATVLPPAKSEVSSRKRNLLAKIISVPIGLISRGKSSSQSSRDPFKRRNQ